MKQLLIFSFLLITGFQINAQDMDNEKLHGIFYTVSDELEGEKGYWKFVIDSTLFICLTDELHNRMRIISPIIDAEEMSYEDLQKCMEANFHSALDIKYSISDKTLWSVFIHPLRELSKEQVISALQQVYSGVKTYGTTYSSGYLSFPTEEERKGKQN